MEDDGVRKWVEKLWPIYDVDNNFTLDKKEAWRFVKDNLPRQVNKANFEEQWALMDYMIVTGSLDKYDMSRFIT